VLDESKSYPSAHTAQTLLLEQYSQLGLVHDMFVLYVHCCCNVNCKKFIVEDDGESNDKLLIVNEYDGEH
jgi:hypothetical protein